MLQCESRVTEVKIEAQAISGGRLALVFDSFSFVFPYSALPAVTCFRGHTASPFFEAGAVVYDGLTEQSCIHPLSLIPFLSLSFPAPPQALGYKRALCSPAVRHDRSVNSLIW